jgi:hypothetical protein
MGSARQRLITERTCHLSPNDSSPGSNGDLFSRNAYLILTMLIQAVAFGVFINSLTVLHWHALDRWPYLVTEFLTIVIITFGYITVSRELVWQLDLLDILFPFLIGLLQCSFMLLLGRVPYDTMWWFVCYLGLMNATVVNLINVRMKTPQVVLMLLVRRRTILAILTPFLLVVAIVACYFDWHVEVVGALFMVEQIGIIVSLYLLELRTRRSSV